MRTFTCIVCPNGCEIRCSGDKGNLEIEGAICAKGKEYVRQELTDPRRTISSLVRVSGGERPLVGVRITRAIPRDRLGEAMAVIKTLRCEAPVRAGCTLSENFLGLGCELIAIEDNERYNRTGFSHRD